MIDTIDAHGERLILLRETAPIPPKQRETAELATGALEAYLRADPTGNYELLSDPKFANSIAEPSAVIQEPVPEVPPEAARTAQLGNLILKVFHTTEESQGLNFADNVFDATSGKTETELIQRFRAAKDRDHHELTTSWRRLTLHRLGGVCLVAGAQASGTLAAVNQ